MLGIAGGSSAAGLQPPDLPEGSFAGAEPALRPPTPAEGCSVHPELESRGEGVFGMLKIHQVPPAAPAQTGTECRYVLPRRALEELHDQLGDLLKR